jgi:ABC-type transport system involved in multi-copper enzyme maturation permease subunit
MMPVVLIAGNFVREQRWVVVLLLVWVFGIGLLTGVAGARVSEDDLLFFLKQQAIYGMSLASFLAATAVHNERRSRRILAVLSKAIRRSEYLAGLLLAVVGILAVYCLAMGLIGTWVLMKAGLPSGALWSLVAEVLAASLLAASLALLFSTLMPPILALAATAMIIGLPAALAAVAGPAALRILPAYLMIARMLNFSLHGAWRTSWSLVAVAAVETVVAWLLASWIFSRRDIAVALE